MGKKVDIKDLPGSRSTEKIKGGINTEPIPSPKKTSLRKGPGALGEVPVSDNRGTGKGFEPTTV